VAFTVQAVSRPRGNPGQQYLVERLKNFIEPLLPGVPELLFGCGEQALLDCSFEGRKEPLYKLAMEHWCALRKALHVKREEE